MKGGTVQIAWHGCVPVLSLHFHPTSALLATGGADHDIKLWRVCPAKDGKALPSVTFEASLSHHLTAVNAVRFSPTGDQLASGADGGDIALWMHDTSDKDQHGWKFLRLLRFHTKDVLDVAWSAKGTLLVSGSVDNSCIVWDLAKAAPLHVLNDHVHYVQGVACDPLDHYIASMSADRTCRIYALKNRRLDANAYTCEHTIAKADAHGNKKCSLFADESLPSFFRRLAWSPDGSFLLTPAGLRREVENQQDAALVFSRKNFARPLADFPSVKSVLATAFCPVTFSLEGESQSFLQLPYRLVFAVATLDSIVIYDTQVLKPLAVLAGIHYGAITDLSWSYDGKYLVASSQDGYCTIVEFDCHELGEARSIN